MRRYRRSHHDEQNSWRWKAVGAVTGRSWPPSWLLVAKLDRLNRSVAFIATLMDSKGFDLAIADMANRLTLHVLAAAEHERHMIGERTRQALAAAKARCTKLGNPKQAEINRAKAAAQAQALRPHLERCVEAGRTSSSAIAADLNARGVMAPNGGRWFPMQVRRVRDRLGL